VRAALLIGALLALGGCKKKTQGPIAYDLIVRSAGAGPVRATVDGQVLGELYSGQVVPFFLPRPPLWKRQVSVSGEQITPDGWVAVEASLYDRGLSEAALARQLKTGKPIEYELRLREPSTGGRATLTIDNRDGQPGEVRVGQMPLFAPPGATRATLPLPTTEAGAGVHIGGSAVGQIARRDFGSLERFILIDASGKRCYSLRVVSYSAPGSTGDPPYQRMLEPAFVHELGTGTSLLFQQPAPSMVTAPAEGQQPYIVEVLDARCAK